MEKKGLIVAIIVVLIIAVYLTFFYNPSCKNYECFQKAMTSCTQRNYINEEPEASWSYSIKGKEASECVIEVKLLQAKQGELNIGPIQGYSMDCTYPVGASAYPEKDLSRCHGRLKEELQTIIINKLHSYIIENLGKFDEKLNSV